MWTMLTLDVQGSGRELDLYVDLSTVRCPFAWGFVLFTGTPQNATIYGSTTFDFSHGQQGVEAYASGPVTVDESTVDYDGARGCDSTPGFNVKFSQIPSGTLHFLAYKSGTPFAGTATLAAPKGGVTLIARADGDRTFYINSSDFGNGAGHVATHSPRFCPNPSLNPENGFCEPGGWWSGGTLTGTDIGLGRRASYTFEQHPYYFFGTNSNLDVSNASVTDPDGRTTQARASAGAWVDRTAVNAGPPRVVTKGRIAQYGPGTYEFAVEKNVGVGADLDVPWHAFGADYFFPGEFTQGLTR
ncbi:MAG: hypothetical protein WDA16_07815 [Candidatus Thermoplasmatota archaeon]